MTSPPMRVAVLVPCFNEEAAVASVVAGFRKALPSADIFVYDNNSKDRTAEIARKAGAEIDLAQLFVTRREDLATRLGALRRALRPDAALWISWPKRSSGVTTTVTEDVVRELALPLGYVDIKVCAVDEVWSGLKLVVRKSER